MLLSSSSSSSSPPLPALVLWLRLISFLGWTLEPVHSQTTTCFQDSGELATAVQEYLGLPSNASDSTLAQIYGWPINAWCVSQIQDFSNLFKGASDFNEPLNQWDVSAAVNMEDMFAFATVFNQDLDAWDVSQVANMRGLFRFAEEFNANISTWNTAQVTDMSNLFHKAVLFNTDISQWDTSRVTNLHISFAETETFDQDIGSWDVSAVTDTSFAFWNTFKFTGKGLENWNVGQVTDASEMFFNAINFNAPIQSWDVQNMELLNEMFRGSAFNQPLDNWDISSATSLWGAFRFASNFNQNLCSWGDIVSPNVNTTAMFAVSGCERTESPNLDAPVSGPWCQSCGSLSPSTAPSLKTVDTVSPTTSSASMATYASLENQFVANTLASGMLIVYTLMLL